MLRRREISEQIDLFKRMWVFRYGAPLRLYGDQEYNKEAFKSMCRQIGTTFIPIAANDHEANGSVESANKVLRSYFNRMRAADRKSPLTLVLAEATHGKNISRGSKLASSFELVYGQRPRILDE